MPLQARIAELIVDDVFYNNVFTTIPTDLQPISDRQDMDAVWGGIEQTLKDMLPMQKIKKPDHQAGEKPLEAVKNHPQYSNLINVKPTALRFYGGYATDAFVG